MISNLRISVAELVIWALLAAAGLTWISLRALDGAAWLMDWLRDRHEPTSYDPDPDDWIDPDADDDPLELPPELTWEQMTSHQLPVVRMSPAERRDWQRRETARKRQARRVEMTHRAHYAAMGMDYPSGLMARVREAGQ